jgi:PAS domain S-box-containing protein
MDKRLNEINARIIEYSLGNFNKRIKISASKDELDAISNGINMLGEELNAATISKNYFNNIFNSISEMVFILSKTGTIQDVNTSVEKKLKYPKAFLIGKSIYLFFKKGSIDFKNVMIPYSSQLPNYNLLLLKNGEKIPARIKLTSFENELHKQLFILTAIDITYEIESENRVLKSIIQGQEKERQRLAKDFHDGLIQELSAIKFQINSSRLLTRNKAIHSALAKPNNGLSRVIKDVRTICFNLMPVMLEEFGLLKAIREFSSQFSKQTKFKIVQKCQLPNLTSELKLDLYHISQEFITNALKHGKADKIELLFSTKQRFLSVVLRDNGIGFDTKKTSTGMGLKNLQIRVKSHNGTVSIQSAGEKGTTIKILIPLYNQLWESQNQ